jgi:hypothetical protein
MYLIPFTSSVLGCKVEGSVITRVACESTSMGSLLMPISASTRSKNEARGAVDSVDSISDGAGPGEAALRPCRRRQSYRV